MKTLVSIIIPVYNAERYLSETIRSVISQTWLNWELILINDGSVDDSEKIINEFLPDDRISHYKQDNSGVSAARNKGLQLSQGELIAFLDADDVWMPLNLEKKVKYLLENSKVGLVHGNMDIIDHHSQNTGEVKSGKEGFIINDLLLWESCCIPAPSSILTRAAIVKEMGGFDPEFSTAADQDLFFRIASRYPVGKIDRVLGKYRVHKHNMHQNISLMEKDHLGVYEKAKKSGFMKGFFFKNRCYSNLYMILAGSWWVNGSNKWKGIRFIFLSLLYNPLNILKLFRKRAI